MRVQAFQSIWLRLTLALGALVAAGAGQWWLSIEPNAQWSAWAWSLAAIFLLLALLDPVTRKLPAREPPLARRSSGRRSRE